MNTCDLTSHTISAFKLSDFNNTVKSILQVVSYLKLHLCSFIQKMCSTPVAPILLRLLSQVIMSNEVSCMYSTYNALIQYLCVLLNSYVVAKDWKH